MPVHDPEAGVQRIENVIFHIQNKAGKINLKIQVHRVDSLTAPMVNLTDFSHNKLPHIHRLSSKWRSLMGSWYICSPSSSQRLPSVHSSASYTIQKYHVGYILLEKTSLWNCIKACRILNRSFHLNLCEMKYSLKEYAISKKDNNRLIFHSD